MTLVTQSSTFSTLLPLKVLNEGTGGNLGVLVVEFESTEESSSEDHSVDTDDNVEVEEVSDEEHISSGME